ncbi:MAG: YmdB family metallophosphoesterase, partial [Chloroflexota bacterium]|nr:YmdB family metallophosphoesterase [Chloroflexota bacterium]
MRVLMIGDVIGKPGRTAVERCLGSIRDERGIDLVTANGENVAGGAGITASTAASLFAAGVDVITSGNHIWDKKEIYAELERDERLLRPMNYGHEGVPGRGWGIYHAADGSEVAVINAQGRTFMQPIENPFTDMDRLLDEGADELPPVRLVDFHCEITSEKNAFGLYLDGRVSA